jgi:uncharacterized repeat protein (TIGR01451 family)
MKTQRRKYIIVAVMVAVLGLLTFSLAFAGSGDSLAANPNPVVESSGQMPPVATSGSITITHSASQVVTALSSVHCGTTGTPYHTPNGYYRVFDLATDFGITGAFDVTAVQYGIENAVGNTGSQPIDVNLYTLSGPLTTANLTLIGTQTDSVPDQALTLFTSSVSGSVPAGGILVVEVFSPDGRDPIFNSFYMGANGAGQTDPSYLNAYGNCGISQPTDTAAIGFPNMHIIINAIGNEVVQAPGIAISKTPATQDVTTNGNADFTITVTNTGDVDLANVNVSDPLVPACDNAIGALTISQTVSYACQDVGVTGSYINVVTVTSQLVTGGPGPSATASAVVNYTSPTSVSLSGFGKDAVGLSPIWLVAILAIILGAGVVVRRKLTA